jgi:hypothetical protein
VDSTGNLFARGGFDNSSDPCDKSESGLVPGNCDCLYDSRCPSKPCVINAGPWFEGGNKIGSDGNNRAGTCNGYDFILMSGGTDRVWINNSNGRVGIGTSSPSSPLEIQDPTNAQFRTFTTSSAEASMWALNSVNSYGLRIDAGGIGHVTQNLTSPVNMLNFTWNSTDSRPQVWIGKMPTTGPHTDFSLAVEGKIVTNALYVTLDGTWADYVFDEKYKLMSLSEVRSFVRKNKHLPGVPSSDELTSEQYNLNLAEMQRIQMEKIEELFLYIMDQEKQIKSLYEINNKLEIKVNELSAK